MPVYGSQGSGLRIKIKQRKLCEYLVDGGSINNSQGSVSMDQEK